MAGTLEGPPAPEDGTRVGDKGAEVEATDRWPISADSRVLAVSGGSMF